MPWAAFGPLDRHGSNPTPSHASPSVRAATPTMLRGTQNLDTAVYWSLTSCHSRKSLIVGRDGCSMATPTSHECERQPLMSISWRVHLREASCGHEGFQPWGGSFMPSGPARLLGERQW
jgi:hypothetical protein